MTRPKLPRRKPYVPRRVPPPLAHPLGAEGFPGLEILAEYPALPGLVLWTCFRDADLWVRVRDPQALFSSDSRTLGNFIGEIVGPEYVRILPSLRFIAETVHRPDADQSLIAVECDNVAEWSEQRSRLATAIEYAQVASLADPRHPLYAVRAARVLKMRAEWARAQSWFDYAVFLARQANDWEAYAYAYSSLGSMHLERGNVPKSRAMLRRSLRIAKRRHLSEREAVACHNLFTVEYLSGNWKLGEEYAVRALALYPEGSVNRPRLARDLAYRTILRGAFAEALPLAQEVLQHFTAPAERALVWSDIARAAAGAGEVGQFEMAWAQAYLLIETENLDPFTINIMLNLAHGAASRGDGFRAALMGARAVQLATERNESGSVFEGEALLDSLRENRAITRPSDPGRGSRAVVEEFLRMLVHERAMR